MSDHNFVKIGKLSIVFAALGGGDQQLKISLSFLEKAMHGFFNCLTIISPCSQSYFFLFSLSLPVKHSTDLCEFMILFIGMG